MFQIYILITLIVFIFFLLDFEFYHLDISKIADRIRSCMVISDSSITSDESLVTITFIAIVFSSFFWFLMMGWEIYRRL
jgi:hypothetical protein